MRAMTFRTRPQAGMATAGPSTSSPTAGASSRSAIRSSRATRRSAAWGVEIEYGSGSYGTGGAVASFTPDGASPSQLWVISCTLVSNTAQGGQGEFDVYHQGGIALGGAFGFAPSQIFFDTNSPTLTVYLGDDTIALNQALGGAGAASVDGQLPSNGGEASGGGLWSEGTSLTINYGASPRMAPWVPAALTGTRERTAGAPAGRGEVACPSRAEAFPRPTSRSPTTKPRAATAARPGPGATMADPAAGRRVVGSSSPRTSRGMGTIL